MLSIERKKVSRKSFRFLTSKKKTSMRILSFLNPTTIIFCCQFFRLKRTVFLKRNVSGNSVLMFLNYRQTLDKSRLKHSINTYLMLFNISQYCREGHTIIVLTYTNISSMFLVMFIKDFLDVFQH